MKAMRGMAVAAALGLAGAALPAGAFAASTPAAKLSCRASMSNARPKDYTTTYVDVSTAARAHVKTVAHYKTTNTTHRGTANSKGKADIPYYISGATPGYTVKVDVTVTLGKKSGSCSTSFTPKS